MLVDINGTKKWMWVIDPNHITQEDFRVNEVYDLWLKNQIELYGRDAVLGKEEPDYLTKLAIELRDGKNYDTGKPLTDLEKAQRWATIASMIAAMGIAGYYANNPLTAGQVTPKRTPVTGNKNGKNYVLDRNKSKGNRSFKKAGGAGIPTLNSLANEVASSLGGKASPLKNGYKVEVPKRKEIYPPEKDDYLELTSINLSNDIINISLDCKEESWLKQYNGCGIVILEIWSKLVVLEADKLKINDDIYVL